MKSLNYNFLAIFISLIALVQAPLFGQSAREMVRDDIPAFSCIELGGDFALDIRYGKQYKVQLSVEELFADYVLSSVMDSTLTVTLDDRRVPAEVRRQFRGKDAPVFRVNVTMPESLRSVKLGGRSILLSADDLVVDPDAFELRVTDNAKVTNVEDVSRVMNPYKLDARLTLVFSNIGVFVQMPTMPVFKNMDRDVYPIKFGFILGL